MAMTIFHLTLPDNAFLVGDTETWLASVCAAGSMYALAAQHEPAAVARLVAERDGREAAYRRSLWTKDDQIENDCFMEKLLMVGRDACQ